MLRVRSASKQPALTYFYRVMHVRVPLQASAADLERRLLAAHEAVAKHLLELGDAEGQLANTRTKAESLEQR